MSISKDEIPQMEFKPVKSSSVQEIGYHEGTQMLGVRFRGGKTYYYKGVAPDIHQELHKSDSIGRFVSQKLVGKFPHRLA